VPEALFGSNLDEVHDPARKSAALLREGAHGGAISAVVAEVQVFGPEPFEFIVKTRINARSHDVFSSRRQTRPLGLSP
jgi:hypothetical protein